MIRVKDYVDCVDKKWENHDSPNSYEEVVGEKVVNKFPFPRVLGQPRQTAPTNQPQNQAKDHYHQR